jgi:hypothetical protein
LPAERHCATEFVDIMPMQNELPAWAARTRVRSSPTDRVYAWIFVTISNPEFLMVVLLCAVGLWLTLCFVRSFPDFGEIADALRQAP